MDHMAPMEGQNFPETGGPGFGGNPIFQGGPLKKEKGGAPKNFGAPQENPPERTNHTGGGSFPREGGGL